MIAGNHHPLSNQSHRAVIYALAVHWMSKSPWPRSLHLLNIVNNMPPSGVVIVLSIENPSLSTCLVHLTSDIICANLAATQLPGNWPPYPESFEKDSFVDSLARSLTCGYSTWGIYLCRYVGVLGLFAREECRPFTKSPIVGIVGWGPSVPVRQPELTRSKMQILSRNDLLPGRNKNYVAAKARLSGDLHPFIG